MKLTWVLLTVCIAVILQVTLARYTIGERWTFDFVLVGVVFAALSWGPTAGIIGGAVGGLLQDVLAGQIVGVGGLAKTVVGFAVGIVGTQLVLTRPSARALIVAVATVLHRLGMLALYGLIDQHWPGVPWGAMLAETGINTATAFLAFQGASRMPAMGGQRVQRRPRLGRRHW